MKLDDNPWEEPSWEVIKDGWQQITNYWEALERSGATETHRLKVVLVGAVRAGQTSLMRGLREGRAAPTTDSERTRGVDVHIQPWRPDPALPLDWRWSCGTSQGTRTTTRRIKLDSLALLMVGRDSYYEVSAFLLA